MDVHEELRDPERISERLEFHRRVIAEEQEAAAVCDRVLNGPSRWWRNALAQVGGSRNAGMVTVLIQRSEIALRQVPADALELSEVATEIASVLDLLAYPYDHVYKVRGGALRQQAYVLSCMGRHHEAKRTADLAGVFLAQIPEPLRELARLDLVRSNIERNMQNYERAVAFARDAAERFLASGARTSRLNALFFEAGAHYSAGNAREAFDIYRSMEQETALLTPEQRAARLHNMAMCASSVGKFDEAARLYTLAATDFERLGFTVNRVKCSYSIGLSMNEAGRYEDAVPLFLKAEVELDALGLESDASLAALMRVEALLALGRTAEVAEVCRRLVERFTRAGVTGAAMTALAYLRETVAIGHATPASVRHVHDFVRDTRQAAMPETRRFDA
jgi:tetratricopeptide (TPR) repeat protein